MKYKYNSFRLQESGSLNYYIDKMNQFRNALNTNGYAITEEAHVHTLLQGLPSKYNQAFIATNQDITGVELENTL